MSYDIQFGVKAAGTPDEHFAVIGEPECSSPTYNVGQMFRACMDWDYNQGEWYPMTEALEKVTHGLKEITDHEDRYLKYNPPNGWGDTGTVKRTLQSILDWVEEREHGWNGGIPLECIYMRW